MNAPIRTSLRRTHAGIVRAIGQLRLRVERNAAAPRLAEEIIRNRGW